jgi:molybdopterin molybdotransferase
MLPVSEAANRILGRIARLGTERVSLWDAYGRILTSEVVAARPLPPFDNSAMDGYAVRAAELPGTFEVVGEIAAGHPRTAEVPPQATVRIMTGAPLPPGVDTIVIQEDAVVLPDGRVTLPAAAVGDHVRRAGEDVAVGDRAIPPGTRLDAGPLAVLAALGHATIEVAWRPRVAILATGDELVDVAEQPGVGQIVDSSVHALFALVRGAGGEPNYLGIVRDDRARTAEALRDALDHDAVITTGGVSVGAHDHVRGALEDAGVALELWKVAMRPGKPVAFGVAGGGGPSPGARERRATPVFGLPGNPVSTMVAFELFVRPALLVMQHATGVDRPRAPVVLPEGYRKPPGRAHFLRAQLERDGDRLIARLHAKQGSGMLSSMLDVDALVEIAAEASEVPAGGSATAILLEPR